MRAWLPSLQHLVPAPTPQQPPQVLCNFGLDVLEALSGTCTLWVVGRRSTWQLVSDSLVAFIIVLVHAIILMCQVRVCALRCGWMAARAARVQLAGGLHSSAGACHHPHVLGGVRAHVLGRNKWGKAG